MDRRSPSLHSRLLIIIVAPLLLVAAVITVWRYHQAQETTQQIYDNNLLSIAHVITRDVVLNQGDLLAKHLLDILHDSSGDKVYYHIIGDEVPTLLSGYTPPPVVPENLRLMKDLREPVFFDDFFRDEAVRVVNFREYLNSPTYTGWVNVRVWQSVDQRQEMSLSLARSAISILGIVLLATAFIVWFGVSYGLKPLFDLQEAIQKRSPNDLSPIKRAVPREVSHLVASTNDLFGQVQKSIDEKDAFIGNAAHQLRNPIAGLLSQAEAAARTEDTDLLHSRANDVAEAARRTARLTQQLLSMERVTQGAVPDKFVPFNIVEVIRERLTLLADQAYRKGIELALTGEQKQIAIKGNPILMGEVIDNLYDNAFRYACRAGDTVTTGIDLHDDKVLIIVSDTGKGIAKSALPDLFDRFTRGEEEGTDGCGLGLAICRSIILSHGGTIDVESDPSGTRFIMELPLSQTQ